MIAAQSEAETYNAALPVVLIHLRYMLSPQFRDCVAGSGKPFGDPDIHAANVEALMAAQKCEEPCEGDPDEEVGLDCLGGVKQVVEMLKSHKVIEYWC